MRTSWACFFSSSSSTATPLGEGGVCWRSSSSTRRWCAVSVGSSLAGSILLVFPSSLGVLPTMGGNGEGGWVGDRGPSVATPSFSSISFPCVHVEFGPSPVVVVRSSPSECGPASVSLGFVLLGICVHGGGGGGGGRGGSTCRAKRGSLPSTVDDDDDGETVRSGVSRSGCRTLLVLKPGCSCASSAPTSFMVLLRLRRGELALGLRIVP